MENEMIERVAKALAKLDRYDPDADPNFISDTMMTDVAWPDEARLWWRYRAPARAAIEAMRVPTQEMREAGYAEIPSDDARWDHSDEIWAAMIDAALKP